MALGKAAAIVLARGFLSAVPALACSGTTPCEVPGGRYYALPPEGWNGRDSLPATIFFHGYNSSGVDFAQSAAFTRDFAAEGVLLVLPDGLNKTWAHQGSPSKARDEIAFMDAVRADLLARWRVDPKRLLVTGFSQGGSMVWDLACRRGYAYRAFAAVAGAFWEPLPMSCPGGPVDLLHLHGTADRTVPMAGRWIRNTWKQGDVGQSLAVLRAMNGCPAEPTRQAIMGDKEVGVSLRCEIWDGCVGRHELRLCRHDGDHLLPAGWVRLVHSWAHALGPREERE